MVFVHPSDNLLANNVPVGELSSRDVDNALDEIDDTMTYSLVGGVSGALVLVLVITLAVINVYGKKKDEDDFF